MIKSKFLKSFGIVLFCLVLFLTFLPSLLSTSWIVHHFVTPLVEARIGGHLSIEKASFRWWGLQSIEGISWEFRESTVHIEQLSIEISPRDLHPSLIRLEGLSLHSPHASLSEGKVSWELQRLIKLHAEGITHYQEGPGHFHIEGVFPSKAEDFDYSSLTGDVVNFPIILLDALGETGGWFSKVLGSNLNVVIREQERVVDFQAATPALTATFQLAVKEDLLSLEKPVLVVYHPTDALMQALQQELSLPRIEVPSRIELTLSQFQWQPGANSTARLSLEVPHLSLPNGLSFKDSTANATLSLSEQKLTIQLAPEISATKQRGRLTLVAENTYHSPLQVTVEGKGLPSQMIPWNLSEEVLGKNFSLEGIFYQDLISLVFSSERLKISPLTFHYGKGVWLDYPLQIEGHLPSSLIPQAKKDVPFLLSLSTFRSADFTPATTSCSGSLSIEEALFSGYEEEYTIKGLMARWEGDSATAIQCSLISRFHVAQKQALSSWSGPQERLTATATLHFSPDWHGVFENLSSEFRYHQTEAHLSGILPLTGAPFLLQGELKTTVPPEWVPSLSLNKPASLQLKLDYLEFDPLQRNWAGMQSRGTLSIQKLDFGEPFQPPIATLSDLQTKWNIEGNKNRIALEMQGNTSNPFTDVHGELNGYFKADQWIKNNKPNFINAQFETLLNFHNIPSLLFQPLLPSYSPDAFLGPVIDLNLKLISKNGQAGGILDLKGEGHGWSFNGGFNVDRYLTLKDPKKPFIAKWTLTPERYQTLAHLFQEPNPLVLNKETVFHLQAKSIRGLISRDPYKMALQTTGELYLTAAPFSLAIATQPEALRIATLEGALESIEGKGWKGTLSLKGEMDRADKQPFQSTLDILLNPEGIPLSTTGSAKNVYLAPLLKGAFFKGSGAKLARLLSGKKLEGEWNLSSYQGPFKLHLQGDNGRIYVEGETSNGLLTLREPLGAELKITPEISASLFHGGLPFLGAVIQADKRWTFSIDPAGFECPLSAFEFNTIKAPSMALDMGRVYLQNDTDVFDVLTMLKAPSQELSIPVWFTPLYLSLNQGKVNLKRVDLLVNDQYPLAVWGSVDFPKDKVNLVIGLTAPTLRAAFGLKGIPNSYVLQLPLKGTTSNAKLDSGRAATQISAFLAQFRGGPQGILLGGVINLLSGEKKAPKPTTKPFPWRVPQEDSLEEEEE